MLSNRGLVWNGRIIARQLTSQETALKVKRWHHGISRKGEVPNIKISVLTRAGLKCARERRVADEDTVACHRRYSVDLYEFG